MLDAASAALELTEQAYWCKSRASRQFRHDQLVKASIGCVTSEESNKSVVSPRYQAGDRLTPRIDI